MDITPEDILQPTKNTVTPSDLAKDDTLKAIVSELIKMNKKLEEEAKFSSSLKKELEEEFEEATNALNNAVKVLKDIKKNNIKSNKNNYENISFASKASKETKPIRRTQYDGRRIANMPIKGAKRSVSEPEIKFIGNERNDAIKKAVQSTINSTLSKILGGTSAYGLLTKGMIADQYDYASEMNKIAFRTEGITDASYDLQKSFRATKDAVKETGYDISLLQGQMIKGNKRGLKDSQSIAKIGLGLSKLIGATEQEAGMLSETFFDWNQKLGISKTELGAVSHEIKEMSRYTGVVGENLANAVKSSEKYLDQMKSAGTLTGMAAKNMILLQTESQKLGIENQVSDLMSALSSTSDLLKANQDTRTLLMLSADASGEMSNLMSGTISQSKTSIKNLAEGMRTTFRTIAGFDIKDLGKMTAEQRAWADMKLKSVTGRGIGDFERMIPTFELAGKTFSDKLADINKELMSVTSSEEKLAIERKKQDLFLTESMSYSAAFADATKNASSFEDALARIQNTMNPKQLDDYNKELSSLVANYSEDLAKQVLAGNKDAIIQAMNISSAEALKKSGGTDFTKQIEKAIKSKDMSKLVKIQERMSKEQQKLGIKDSTIGDPIERAADQIKILNENFVGYTGSALMWAAQTAGSTGIMAGLLGLIVAQNYFGMESIQAWGNVLLTSVKSLGGYKAAQTATQLAIPETAGLVSLGAGTTAAATGAEAATGAATATAAGLTVGTVAEIFAPVLIVLGGIGAITGSFWAADEAINHFDTSLEELTLGQLYASKGAGMLTGALNWMSLGIFNNWLGPAGSLTKSLAQLTEKVPVLSLVAAGLDVVIGTLYGVYKLIKNILVGIFDAISYIVTPFIDAIMSISDMVVSIFSPFFSLNEVTKDTSGIISGLSDALGMLGTIIGGVFKGIGFLINVLILKPLEFVITTISKIIKFTLTNLLSPIVSLFNSIKGVFKGLFDIIYGIFTFDLSLIVDGYKNLYTSILKGIGSLVLAIPIAIWNSFTSLADNEYFGAIFKPFVEVLQPVYDAIMSVVDAFSALFEPFKELFNFGNKEGKGLLDVIKYISSAIGSLIRVALYPVKIIFEAIAGVIKLVIPVLNALKEEFTALVSLINKTVYAIIHPFEFLYDVLVGHSIIPDLVTAIISLFGKLATNVLSKLKDIALFGKSNNFDLSTNAMSLFSSIKNKIFKTFSDSGFFSTIASKFKSIKGAAMSFFEPLAKSVKSLGKSGVVSKILGSVKSLGKSGVVSKILGFGGKAVGFAGKAGASLLKKLPGIGLLVGSGLAISELMKGNFKGALKEFTSGLLSLIPGIGAVLSFAMDFFGDKLIDGAISLGKSIWEGVVSIWDWFWGSEESGSIKSKSTDTATATNAASAYAENATSNTSIKPVSYTSSYEKLRRNKAQENDVNGSPKVGALHLSDLVTISGEQLFYMKKMAETNERLLRIFETNNSISGETDIERLNTKGKSQPRNSPNYNQWQFGRYDQNASLQVISTGV